MASDQRSISAEQRLRQWIDAAYPGGDPLLNSCRMCRQLKAYGHDDTCPVRIVSDAMREWADIHADADHVRAILAADRTREPHTEPLPDIPSHVGPLAFSVYGAIQELRQLRAQLAALTEERERG